MACGQQWFCIGSFWFSQVLKVPSALFPVVFQQLQQFRLSGFSPVLTVSLASSGKLIAFGKVKRLTRLQKAHWINCSNVYQWGYIFDLSDSTYYLNKKKLHCTLPCIVTPPQAGFSMCPCPQQHKRDFFRNRPKLIVTAARQKPRAGFRDAAWWRKQLLSQRRLRFTPRRATSCAANAKQRRLWWAAAQEMKWEVGSKVHLENMKKKLNKRKIRKSWEKICFHSCWRQSSY